MRVTGPGQSANLLLDVIDILAELGIPYAVIGALAVSFHGIPRSTNDADAAIWLKGTGKTEADLTRKLGAAGYRALLRLGDSDDPVSGVVAVEDRHANQLDLIVGIRGMDPDTPRRSIEAPLSGTSIKMISPEDLIAMKVFAGGIQDLEDVNGVLQVSGDRIDLVLLRNLAKRYGADVLQKLNSILKSTSPGD
jgi:hypothetical protein